ncbi:LOW QUALITY PROTEIN: hypothetical protein Bca4012_031676 [Brassica carinata]
MRSELHRLWIGDSLRYLVKAALGKKKFKKVSPSIHFPILFHASLQEASLRRKGVVLLELNVEREVPWGKPRKEVHEEGEIRHEGSGSNSLQHEVMPKPATPSRMQQGTSQPLGDSGMVIANPVEKETDVELEKLNVGNNLLDKEGISEELERSKEDLEEGVTNVDGEVMELGEVPENWEEADAILELVHEFQNLADGENKEVSKDDASGAL